MDKICPIVLPLPKRVEGMKGRKVRNTKNLQLRAVMDSGTLALLYFDVILLDGSRAAAPKGTMSRRTHGEL